MLTLTDVVFCLLLLLGVGGALFFINAGDLRLYVWVGLLLGGWSYRRFLSRIFSPGLRFLVTWTGRVAAVLEKIGSLPLRLGKKLYQTLHGRTKMAEEMEETDTPVE